MKMMWMNDEESSNGDSDLTGRGIELHVSDCAAAYTDISQSNRDAAIIILITKDGENVTDPNRFNKYNYRKYNSPE